MSSNSPSGGMNEMVRSFSKRDRRTHWWNLTSSISIALPRDAASMGVSVSGAREGEKGAEKRERDALRPVFSNMTLSLRPNRNSGIPLR